MTSLIALQNKLSEQRIKIVDSSELKAAKFLIYLFI